MSYPLPLTRTEAYLAYKAGVIQQSELKPSLAVPRIGIDDWLAYWTGLKNDYPKNPDGTPKMLQEEEKYIAYLCGVTDTYPEKCLRRVGAYLRYLISARWGRPDHPLNREELYLSLIKTQFIPSGDPSSDIVIDGTTKAPFVDVKLYGDTFQQSYTGKNLYYDTDGYKQGFIGDNGMIVPTTQSVSNATYIEASENTQYVMSFNAIGSGTTLRGVGFYDSNKNYISRVQPDNSFTFTTPQNTAYIRVNFYNANGLDATNFPTNYISDIQLELGTTPTSGYEPYTGGQPSPNPEYPQPIKTVTGIQTVEVRGKNLWGGFASDFSKTNNSVAFVNKANGTITANGTATATALSLFSTDAISQNRLITLSPGDYTISGATDVVRLEVINTSGGVVADTSGTIAGAKAFSISAPTQVAVRAKMGITAVANNVTIKPMLEKGSTATVYEPYSSASYPISLGSIELCKLDTYQDYIWKDGDDWKVHKELGNVTLNSTYYNSRYGTNSYGLTQFLVELGVSDYYDMSGYTTMLSNSFTRQSTTFSNTQVQGFLPALDSNSHKLRAWIRISTTTADTTAQFKAWLNTNTPIFYYKLNTATDTTITDQTLIAQLDSLVNGGAENGTTYIKVNATDPNLPGLLVVEAPKYE